MITLKMYYDLYALDALSLLTQPKAAGGLVYDTNNQFCEVAHVHEGKQRTYDEVKRLFNTLAKNMAVAVRDYLFLACLGEARHAWNMGTLALEPLQKGGERHTVYKNGHLYDPDAHFPLLAQVFYGWVSGGGFGGKKWANIAEAGAMFNSLSPFAFLDHCADLEHNGGYVYNKSGVTPITGFALNVDQHSLKAFLEWKLKHNILLEPYTIVGGKNGSPASGTTFSTSVSRLIQKYYAMWKLATPPAWMYSCYGYHEIELEGKPIKYQGEEMYIVTTSKFQGDAHEQKAQKYPAAPSVEITGYSKYESVVTHDYTREE